MRGQVLSTRPDLLPDTYIQELEHLQDDVTPIDTVQVVSIIEEELQAPEDIVRELRAGRFHAHHGLLQGKLTYFTEESLEEAAPGLAT